MPGADELEEGLRRDRLRRQRFVAVVIVLLCAAGATFYYALFVDWPQPIRLLDGRVLETRLTLFGWLKLGVWGLVIGLAGLGYLIRAVALTVRIHRRPGR
jgi:hypothetical protein